MSWRGSFVEIRSMHIVHFHKFFTPGNEVKLRCFMQQKFSIEKHNLRHHRHHENAVFFVFCFLFVVFFSSSV